MDAFPELFQSTNVSGGLNIGEEVGVGGEQCYGTSLIGVGVGGAG